MEAKIAPNFRIPCWANTGKVVERPGVLFCLSTRCAENQRFQMPVLGRLSVKTSISRRVFEVSCAARKFPDLRSGGFPATFDEALILKNKAQEIDPYLDGRCIFLVGMMGSGKTTVGRILSDVLGFSFFDSDVLVEQAVGGKSVSEIFDQHGESFFRDQESEVLRKLSSMHRLVVSTGGGAVIRSTNWRYMRRGVSVWLDVPLDSLARRIAAVGTNSRPLLHHESGDSYSKTFMRLSNLLQERTGAYANANVRVSLESVAAKLCYLDVDNVMPSVIAIEALEQIKILLQ